MDWTAYAAIAIAVIAIASLILWKPKKDYWGKRD